MKKLSLLCVSTVLLTLLASPASGLLRFGVHGGFDMNDQAIHKLTSELLSNGDEVSITRDEIKSPLMGGVHLYLDATPFLDFEFGLEGSLRKYHVLYEHVPVGELARSFEDDVTFHRISAYASAKMNMINLPLVKTYVGGGAGYHRVGPLLSRELLEEQVVAQGLSGDDLAPGKILDRNWTFGGHALFGLRIKPTFVPLALSLEGRYYMLEENAFGDNTNRFLTVAFGLELGL